MGSRRSCQSCGRTYVAKAAHQKYCSATCRKRGLRGAQVVELPTDAADMSVVEATRSTLVAVGRQDTPSGQAALVLAAKLDRGGDTGSAMAALVRELRASVADAVGDVESAGDPVDELKARREARLRSS